MKAVPTMPKENLSETFSEMRFPDWVENEIKEGNRQERAKTQFHKIVGTDVGNVTSYDRFFEDDAEFAPTSEIDKLLEANENIEI